jgi:hypothetical protein
MDFKAASDHLTHCITLADIADEAGMAEGTIRQARLDPTSKSYRSPPSNWPAVVAELAEKRARELQALADELRKAAGS